MRAAMTRIRLKGAAVAAASVAMAVVLTACGGDTGSDKPESKTKEPSASSDGQKSQAPAPAEEDDGQVLATITGKDGVVATVSSAKRESGGFITVKGRVANGSKQIWAAVGWQGMEQELVNNGASMAGASLVDREGKKRYLILRDTDGRCLCTKFEGLPPGGEAPFFAQFPAPPETTSEVEFQIPTMPTATIKISG
ncbi:hypothetical protein [Streptomyces sp. NPDC060035]|uniref:hypothetical protein n=1 Tax=Streptomyces sp. NPDC060035 TaxID=3347044 RepID=UPI0036AA80D0